MTAHPLRPATRQSLGRPSPHQQADRPRAHPPPKQPKPVESFQTHPCEQARTPRISHPFKRLSRSEGQVTHVLLTRSPLTPPPKKKGTRPVRLACVKHAASVRPEPGSNSPKKPKKQTTHQPKQPKKPPKVSTQPIPIAQKTNPDPNQYKQPTPPPSASHNTPQPTQPEDTTTNQKKQGKPKTKNKTKWHKKQTHYRDLKQHTHKQNKQMKNLPADHSRRLEYFRKVVFSWSNPESVIPLSQEVPTIGTNVRHHARAIPAGSPALPSTP